MSLRNRLKNVVIPPYMSAQRLAEFLQTLPKDAEIRGVFQPVDRREYIISVSSACFPEVSAHEYISEVQYREWEGRPNAG